MALQCNEEKMARLPIDGRYKQAFKEFCSMPDNESACQLLCDAPDEVIVEKIKEIEQTVGDWAVNGPPPELVQQAQMMDPETTAVLSEGLERVRPEAENRMRDANSFANGGLASLGRFGDTQMSHTAKGEVVVPNSVFSSNPGLREGLGSLMEAEGADPARYTVGGPKASVNPYTGMQEFFSLGGLIGGVVGFAVCGPACAAVGAGGGTFIETGDVKESLLMAAGGYALGTAAVGAGFGAGAGGAAMTASTEVLTGSGMMTVGDIAMLSAEEAAMAGVSGSQLAAASEFALGGTTAGMTGATLGGAKSLAAESVMSNAASMGGRQAAGQMIPAATEKAIDSSAFDYFSGEFMDKPLLTAEQSGLPFNITAGDVTKAAPYVASMFEERPPARTNPWSDQEVAYAQQIASQPMIDTQQYQQNLQNFKPIDTSKMVGYNGSSYAQQPPLYTQRQRVLPQPQGFACGGPVEKNYERGGGVSGAGTSTSDSIPARLSDGEFVMTTDAVMGMGNGDLRDGARKMYDLMDQLERKNA